MDGLIFLKKGIDLFTMCSTLSKKWWMIELLVGRGFFGFDSVWAKLEGSGSRYTLKNGAKPRVNKIQNDANNGTKSPYSRKMEQNHTMLDR
jgi:hypothetical protein